MAAALLCLFPGLLWAQDASQRPKPRPFLAEAAQPAAIQDAAPLLRPKPRPLGLVPVVAAVQVAEVERFGPRPRPRPQGLGAPEAEVILAAAPQPEPQVQKPGRQTMKGAVCGRAEIKGRQLAAMRSTRRGCGIAEPVEVTSIAGVTLSPAPTINCEAASAISDWISGALQPAFNNQVAQLRVADSYSCRPRNNVRGNPPSVHGKGEAIDFSAVVLTSGKAVEVKSRLDRRWQKARKNACGIFTVILGPGSDGYHETHIHLDVSQHGGRPYCR
nr:extensin family protein [Stagnihabitans tardus]